MDPHPKVLGEGDLKYMEPSDIPKTSPLDYRCGIGLWQEKYGNYYTCPTKDLSCTPNFKVELRKEGLQEKLFVKRKKQSKIRRIVSAENKEQQDDDAYL